MGLHENVKQAFSALQKQISSDDKYILITKKDAIFKNKNFIKKNNVWVENNEENNSDISNIIANINLNTNEMEDENIQLKIEIEELKTKIRDLKEKDKEKTIPKKKVSGKLADQEKIKNSIIRFLITIKF
ncbi:hypothetical protein C1645_812878 [Glomus cerebriforme]|uniref:Uncharacterized protein n=1 Tax=Glomus cerebriforme TaxID=658196 RepID=A0A397TLR4_9GLOM|nr:hypothetical protein C1645_812878 [Glomus cerebriforme]